MWDAHAGPFSYHGRYLLLTHDIADSDGSTSSALESPHSSIVEIAIEDAFDGASGCEAKQDHGYDDCEEKEDEAEHCEGVVDAQTCDARGVVGV